MLPKFRAWDKHLKIIRKVQYIDFENQELKIYADEYYEDGYIPNLDIVRNFDEFEIMQSTGLKDKNGIEIFEGDILKGDDGEVFYNQVWFDEEKAKFMRYEDIELWENVEELEVIGNIYENPEFLEG